MSNLKTRKTAAPKDEFIAKNIRSSSLIMPSKQSSSRQTDKFAGPRRRIKA